jgi:hypothetical protein
LLVLRLVHDCDQGTVVARGLVGVKEEKTHLALLGALGRASALASALALGFCFCPASSSAHPFF